MHLEVKEASKNIKRNALKVIVSCGLYESDILSLFAARVQRCIYKEVTIDFMF